MVLQTRMETGGLIFKNGSDVADGYANVLGYSTPGDGGGGDFYWDNTSNEADNGGTIFQVSGVDMGRWKRLYSGALNVKWFGAIKEDTADNTEAIQKALDYCDNANGSVVFFPKGRYLVTGKLTMSAETVLHGDKYSASEGTGTSFPSTPLSVNVDSALLFKPTSDIANDDYIITMGVNCGIIGMGLIFPNQSIDTTTITPIQYPTLINATHGCSLKYIRTWGAWHFFYTANAESLFIDNVYGWSYGTMFDIERSTDVCHFTNIHLNPNVIRPSTNVFTYFTSSTDSKAFVLNGADGILLSNIMIFGYRIGIQALSDTAIAQRATMFNLSNFLFDATGLAFDLQSNGWNFNIQNGVIISGASSDPSTAGFLRATQSSLSANIVNINISNVTVSVGSWTWGGTTPACFINILNSGFDYRILANNLTLNGPSLVQSTGNATLLGSIANNSVVYLLNEQSTKELVTNPTLRLSEDGSVYNWSSFSAGAVTFASSPNGTVITNTGAAINSYQGAVTLINYPITSGRAYIILSAVTSSTLGYVELYNSSGTILETYSNLPAVQIGNHWIIQKAWSGIGGVASIRIMVTPTAANDACTVNYVGCKNNTAAQIEIGNLKDTSTVASKAELRINGGALEYYSSPVWQEALSEAAGTWSITTGTIITESTATFSKIGKQVALSGSLTFATISTAASITLPFAPDYGGIFLFNTLTFTLTNGSASATVKSTATGAQTFQINYMTE